VTSMFPTRSSEAAIAPSRDRGGGYFRDLDWILIIAALCASLMGSVLVWSGSRADLASPDDPQSYLKRHLMNLAIALVLGVVATRINYRWLRAYTPVVYVGSLILLLVPFIPGLGVTIAGARAWINIPFGTTIQPSEFVKITVVLMMAALLSERKDIEEEPTARDVLLALGAVGLPMLIIVAQNDTGTAMVMGALAIAVIAVAGVKTRWLIGLIGATVLGLLAAVQLGLLQQYQINRLTSFLNPEGDPSATGWNANQARIAIGGGGLDGYGLFQGPQTQGNFVPVNESDFVFTVAGEELGFIGSALLILLLSVVLWRAVVIAWKADDMYGRLVATGVAAWLAFQMFENIGMNVGIMPITGIPLPLVSAGGTSLMATWIAIGLLQIVRLHSLAVLRSQV
jgi:rod shape determining protein RodA